MRSFTAEELEQATGFDRRTIAYYVQEDLLPRVGRRGPRTRYPQHVMDRLLFIRKVRKAEQAGEISAISLSELRDIFDSVAPEVISKVAEGRWPINIAISEAGKRHYRRPIERQMARDIAWSATAAPEAPQRHESRRIGSLSASAPSDVDTEDASLAEALSELQSLARAGQSRDPDSVDVWSRIEISPEITLSVRGLAEAEAPLLQSVAKKLRELLYGD